VAFLIRRPMSESAVSAARSVGRSGTTSNSHVDGDVGHYLRILIILMWMRLFYSPRLLLKALY